MPSIRRHIITGEPILFAPERGERPHAFGREDADVCPFCPGNEELTPPEIERAGDPWRVRVFPNKYPAADKHEVIVESPEHGASFDSISHAGEAVQTYVRRYRAHSDSSHVALFSNQGRRAGASISHIHSQVIPLPFIPPRVAAEMAAFSRAERCPLCAAPEEHERSGLVIEGDERFTWIAPSGSSHAYEQWIVPRRHHSSLTALTAEDIEALASILQRASAATRRVSESYNVLFMNFADERQTHFYIAITPRLAMLAGFELSTGTFIDIIDPAAAVRALR